MYKTNMTTVKELQGLAVPRGLLMPYVGKPSKQSLLSTSVIDFPCSQNIDVAI